MSPRLLLAKTPPALEPLTISPRAWILPCSILRLLVALLPTLFSAMRSRRHLVIENLALRQQLATFASRLHPDIRPADRMSGSCCAGCGAVGPGSSRLSGRARSCAGIAPGSASTGTGCPDEQSVPAVLPCLGKSEHSSGGWPPRIPGARPASTESCCASASTSPSAASPDTCAHYPAHRGPTPPGGRSFGATGTASPRWTSATADAPWSAAPSPRVQPLPGSRSSYARPFPSTRHRAF